MVATSSASVSTAPNTLSSLCKIVREDLLLLALLQDRELEAETLRHLWREEDELLGLRLATPPALEALGLLRQGLNDIPQALDSQTLDILAAEFADIYLNHHHQASPCESVWLDEDGLMMQEPMFQLRGWYQRHDLQVRNWRLRTDDHLVTQLQFIGFLLEDEASPERLEEIGRFLDEHLLRWIGAFSERVGSHCQTRFYAGLTSLTAAYLEEFRDLIALILGVPRPSSDEIAERMRPPREILGLPVAGPVFPAAANEGPGW